MAELLIASALLGMFVGLAAGLFGIGGGVLIVPVLSWLLSDSIPPQQILLVAIATSLASALFTSLSSVRSHHRLGNVIWQRVWRLAPALLVGSAAGAVLAEGLDKTYLKALFLGYLLYTSWHLLRSRNHVTKNARINPIWDGLVGILIGVLSALVGIGGGTMTVPYLVKTTLPMKNAVASSSACALPITLSGALSYMVLGWHQPQLPEFSLGYVYLPAFVGIVSTSLFTAPIGAKLANRLPAAKLKRYFAVLLLVMAAKLASEFWV